MVVAFAPRGSAHCDSLDGPVVKAAQAAIAEGNVNRVLIWVQPADEAEIKRAFTETVAVRKLGPEAERLADRHFFETLVRVHRAREGAPFTGLKPAGTREPGIDAADRSLETGELDPLVHQLTMQVDKVVREHFAAARRAMKFAPDDVAAGRSFVQAYVSYIHYVDGVHQAAGGLATGHPGEPAEVAATRPHEGHTR